jgi:hypothetical protein
MEVIFKGFIEDVKNEKCSDLEMVVLSQCFASALIPFAKYWKGKNDCKKTYYDNLVGFEGTEKDRIEEFDLKIEKTKSDDNYDHFEGIFTCDNKRLRILAKVKNS